MEIDSRVLHPEDRVHRGRGHEPRNVEGLKKLEDTRTNSALEPPKEMQPCCGLDFSPIKHILNF